MSKKNTWLYYFKIPRLVESEIEIDPITDEEGNEIKQFKTIKKETPVTCAIKKPTRSIYEAGELYYSVELSKFIQAGMLTKTLLAKRFANDGGALSEKEQNHYSELYSALHTKEQEVQRIQLDTENAKKRAKKLQTLLLEITSIRQQLVEFESTQSALFDQTAEHKARNKAILWWVLHLSYIKDQKDENEKEIFRDLFAGEDIEEKLESYDAIEEGVEFKKGGEQEHLGLALKKFAYFISFWYSGQAVDKEGFEAAEKLLDEVDIFDASEEAQQQKQEGFKDVIEKETETLHQLQQELVDVHEKIDKELESSDKENLENIQKEAVESEAKQEKINEEINSEQSNASEVEESKDD